MPRVVHTGQALVDLVVSVPDLPARGGNVNAGSTRRYAGGAVNVLVAAARSGARAVHAGSIGTGPEGDLVRATLGAEEVAVATEPVPGDDTGVCIVLVEPDGERSFVTGYGAERTITPASLGRSEPEPGDVVCVTGYSLFDPTREPLLEWLATLPAGVSVVLDPGDVFAHFERELQDRMLELSHVWTSNRSEASALTGEQGPGPAAAAVQNRMPHAAAAIVRDGERGCHVHADGVTTHVLGFPQDAVDTNGAGDAHTGVLLAERVLGADWLTAARRANAAAALKVTRRGPATAATRAEVDAFLAGLA